MLEEVREYLRVVPIVHGIRPSSLPLGEESTPSRWRRVKLIYLLSKQETMCQRRPTSYDPRKDTEVGPDTWRLALGYFSVEFCGIAINNCAGGASAGLRRCIKDYIISRGDDPCR